MLVRPLSTMDNTRDYARVSHSRQWSKYNIFLLILLTDPLGSHFTCLSVRLSVTVCTVAKRYTLQQN